MRIGCYDGSITERMVLTMIMHSNEVVQLADRIIRIEDGRISE